MCQSWVKMLKFIPLSLRLSGIEFSLVSDSEMRHRSQKISEFFLIFVCFFSPRIRQQCQTVPMTYEARRGYTLYKYGLCTMYNVFVHVYGAQESIPPV
jgi:hypothetical protein